MLSDQIYWGSLRPAAFPISGSSHRFLEQTQGETWRPGKLPGKGYYEALVAPWPSDKPTVPTSPTLGALAAKEARVHISCRNPSCDHLKANHYGLTLQAAEAAKRWGAETTLLQLRPKVICKLCGARWPNVAIEVSAPAAKIGA